MKVSVCMATYNGMDWIAEQVDSILTQSVAVDEIVFVDDCSTDETFEYLENLDLKVDKYLYRNPKNVGVIRTFERAFSEASGDVIFLCDQDDLWMDNKVEKVLATFKENPQVDVVVHDAKIVDVQGESCNNLFYSDRPFSSSVTKNLIMNRFHGCCMAARKSFLRTCQPFPDNTPMHDWWLGLKACRTTKCSFIDEPLIKYRIHGKNLTGQKGSWAQQLSWRWRLLRESLLK